METACNLHEFAKFPANLTTRFPQANHRNRTRTRKGPDAEVTSGPTQIGCLWARADRRVRDRCGAFGVLLLAEPDALPGIVSGARDATDLRKAADRRGAVDFGRIGHEVGHADVGELVFDFAACTGRNRRCRAGVRRNGEHCDRRSSSDRDSESPRKDQSSSWKLEGRHRHAFSSLLTVSSRKGTIAVSELTATIRFPAYAASEVEAGVGIC